MHTLEENLMLVMRVEDRIRELIGRSTVISDAKAASPANNHYVYQDRGGRGVSARVRRPDSRSKSDWHFTIRTVPAGGVGETEYHDFLRGDYRLFFYGKLDQTKTDFSHWMLINLATWREAASEPLMRFPLHCGRGDNDDGSRFWVYDATSSRFGPGLMVDCSHPERFISACRGGK